jgi:hypothetical protein
LIINLDSVWKQVTAASWHCHQRQHIFPSLLTPRDSKYSNAG